MQPKRDRGSRGASLSQRAQCSHPRSTNCAPQDVLFWGMGPVLRCRGCSSAPFVGAETVRPPRTCEPSLPSTSAIGATVLGGRGEPSTEIRALPPFGLARSCFELAPTLSVRSYRASGARSFSWLASCHDVGRAAAPGPQLVPTDGSPASARKVERLNFRFPTLPAPGR